MYFKKTNILLLLLTLVILQVLNISKANGQTDSLRLKGSLEVQNVGNFKYQIVIAQIEGKWHGYSLLDAGGSNETKTSINLQFMPQKNALAFHEKKLLYTKSKEQNFCYVGGVLKWNEKRKELKGMFMGKDSEQKLCGTGKIKLNAPQNAEKYLRADPNVKDTSVKVSLITQKISEHIKVKASSISLEVWDGGVEDEDSVQIRLNHKLIVPAFKINKEKQKFTIALNPGENTLEIEALNEGIEAPNSARIIVQEDGKAIKSMISFLKKGEAAKVILKR